MLQLFFFFFLETKTFLLRCAFLNDLFEVCVFYVTCLICGCGGSSLCLLWHVERNAPLPPPKFSVRDHRLTKKLLYALIKTVFRLHILNDPQRKAPLIWLL